MKLGRHPVAMSKLRIVCAVLLALPLILFGGNHFVQAFELPPGAGGAGEDLLQALRDGGLMTWIAASHVVIGLGLLVPRTRFAAGLLQLPISLGIVAFHATMLPEGNGIAIVMLVLNLALLFEPLKIYRLFGMTRE